MRDAGFTLVEVLAALMVFSFGIIGLTHAGTESARAVSALDQKMLAGIVADNQLVVTRRGKAELGVRSGQSKQMSRTFIYEVVTTKTEVDDFFKVTTKVRLDGQDQVLVERAAYRMVEQ